MRGSALIAAGLVAAAVAPAAADPCTVDMVRVPDDVRPVIERWVSAEPSCRVHLAVRVLPSEGGYYVLATDSAGVVRERMVPDATTAAVLIASWVADDGGTAHTPTPTPTPSPTPTPTPSPMPTPAPSAPVTPPWAQTNPPVTPTWAQTSPPVRPAWAQASPPVRPDWAAPPAGPGATPPSAIAPTGPIDAGAPQAHRPAGFRRLVALGVTVHGEGGGIRGEIDLFKKWHLRFGLVGGWIHTQSYDHYRDLALDDVLVAASAGNELRSGRFDVRATVGLGIAITTGTHMNTGSIDSSLSPFGNVALTGGVRLTSRFELRTGIDVTYMPQRINNGEWFWDRGEMAQFFVGLGFRAP